MTTHRDPGHVAPHSLASVRRRLAVVLAFSLLLTTIVLGAGTRSASAQNSFDRELIDLVNDHRESIGLHRLVSSPSLSAGSLEWSETMKSKTGWTGFYHDPDRPAGVAENIAVSPGLPGTEIQFREPFKGDAGPLPSYCTQVRDGSTARSLFCQWMDSAPHRSAIESPYYRQVGAGTAVRKNGDWVENFSTMRFSAAVPEPTPVADPTPEPEPTAVADETPFAEFTSPGDDAELCAGDRISWSGPESGKYRLRLGTSAAATDIMNQSTSGQSLSVPALPADHTLHATLLHRPDGGSWVVAATRTFSPCANPVELNAASTLCSGDEISWSGPKSGRYKLRIGTTHDGTDAMNQGTSRLSIDAAPNLPTEGELHVTLRHKGSDGVWDMLDTAVYEPCPKPVEIVAPSEHTPLCTSDLIDWVGHDSGKYRIRVGTTYDGTDLLNKSTSATEYRVGDLASESDMLYVSVRHQAVAGGSWALHATMELYSC